MKLFGSLRSHTNCAAVIVAAGSSRRMEGIDKIMAPLCGDPVIAHTIRAFQLSPYIDEIVVVTRRDLLESVEELVAEPGYGKVTAVVEGGSTRVQSVQNGLNAVGKDMELVAVQDGARPLVTEEIIAAAVKKAEVVRAAAPAIALKDTVKVADGEGRVLSTPDRASLRAVQTPQVFDRDMLLAAWKQAEKAKKDYTDDCGAMEAFGKHVFLTEGSEENLKITTQMDLRLAEMILKQRSGLL